MTDRRSQPLFPISAVLERQRTDDALRRLADDRHFDRFMGALQGRPYQTFRGADLA